MTTAADLQAEFRAFRSGDAKAGIRSARTRDAYNRWFHQACIEGNPPDALQPNAGTDLERFFARTIPGPDGHTYWEPRAMRFYPRDGGQRHCRWWWYEHVHGNQGRGTLAAVCGERNCITPDHQLFVSWAEARRRFTDEQMLGAIQVSALSLGHTPTAVEYSQSGRRPSDSLIRMRFGTWERAVTAAGLEPSPLSIHRRGPEDCIAGLRWLASHLGHAPSDKEYRAHAAFLKSAGHPPSATTIRTHLGRPWSAALAKAGLA